MEILVTIVAFWLILMGLYGIASLIVEKRRNRADEQARPLPRVKREPAPSSSSSRPFKGPFEPASIPSSNVPSFIASRPSLADSLLRQEQRLAAVGSEAGNGATAPRLAAPEAEVSFLRAQIEHLRSEMHALSSSRPERSERPQQRRYRTGNYTYLPRSLRRQVNEARDSRRFHGS